MPRRQLLERHVPDYFTRLEAQLSRPENELYRCWCAPRYVSVLRTSNSVAHRGREYYNCPLYGGKDGRQGCGFFEWDR